MTFRRSTAGLVAISLFWLALAAFSGVKYWLAIEHAKIVVDRGSVTKLFNDFYLNHAPMLSAIIGQAEQARLNSDLFRAETLLPFVPPKEAPALARIQEDGALCAIDSPGAGEWNNQRKLRAWFAYKCKKSSSLDPAVWRSPPHGHPQGGSWAYWLFQQGYGGKQWLEAERAYLHISETRFLPPSTVPLENVLQSLSPGELELFRQGGPVIVSEHYLIVFSVAQVNGNRLQVFPRVEWDKYLNESEIQRAALDSAPCDYVLYRSCWSVREDLREPRHKLYLTGLLLSIVGLVSVVILTLWLKARSEKRDRENQQLIIQTLTHELRHPVMGLMLSAEAFRGHYDLLSEDLKKESLRLISSSARMNRLVESSQQYLKLSAEDEQFKFRKDKIQSANEFLEGALENYSEKIQIAPSETDTSCTLDGYWVATCLVNLTKNALMHGKQPVQVSWARTGNNIIFCVQDSGTGPTISFSELVRPRFRESLAGGMGLGLSLVYRLAHLMNGSLQLEKSPTRFTLTLRGVCDGQNSAG